MSVKPSEIRNLLAKASEARTEKAGRYSPEVLSRIGANRAKAESEEDSRRTLSKVTGTPTNGGQNAVLPPKNSAPTGKNGLLASYGPGAVLDYKTEDALSLAAAPPEPPRGDSQEDTGAPQEPPRGDSQEGTEAPRRKKRVGAPVEEPSKSDLLRSAGFNGLAELEDMQNSPLGSTSSLSGPGSRRMISSPARSLERQARRYSKMGPAGKYAAGDLLKRAADIRAGEPGLRTQDGIKSNQTASSVADNLAKRAILGASGVGNEMPPNTAGPQDPDRKKRGLRDHKAYYTPL